MATEKQIIALKKFAKNKELSNGILKGVQFDELSKEEATELVGKCYDHVDGDNEGNGWGSGLEMRFSANYRNGDGAWRTVSLTDEEVTQIREAHRKHCQEMMEECAEDYPDEPGLQLAVFRQRADKVFTWIQQALDEKVRRARN